MRGALLINATVMGTLLERDSRILEQNPNCAPRDPQKVEISVTMDLSSSHLDLSGWRSEICEELPGLCPSVKNISIQLFAAQFVNLTPWIELKS